MTASKPASGQGGGAVRGSLAQGPFSPSRARRFAVWALLGIAVLAIDQATKAVARDVFLAQGVGSVDVLPGVVCFRFVANRGAAFGIGQGFGLVSVLLAAAVVAATAVYFARARTVTRCELAGLGLVLGGAVGNALDRLANGYVTDFIATQFIDFPVFNVADIAIVAGVALAFVGFAFLSPAGEGEGSGR